MKWFQPEVLKYILAVIARDSSIVVSRHVASNMCESLAIQFAIGEIKMPAKEPEPILIEEDATKPEVAKEPKKSELDLMIKTLRKDKEIGRNAVLRKSLMNMMLQVISSVCHCFIDTLFQKSFIGPRSTMVNAKTFRLGIPSCGGTVAQADHPSSPSTDTCGAASTKQED